MADPLLEFDPTSEDAANSPLSVWNTASYMVDAFNAPAPPATVQWASSVDTEGSLPAARKHENRVISLTIACLSAAALRSLQAKVAKIAREGGTLKATFPAASEVVIFDLLSADTFEPQLDVSYYTNTGAFCLVNLTLTAKPYGRGTEQDLGDNTETTLPVLIFTETGIKGDMPGLGRLVIDNDSADQQRALRWGIQSRHYSNAATAALFYQAESCALDGATISTVAGASGGGTNNAVTHSAVAAYPSDSILTYIGTSSTAQTHVGTYRVLARVLVPSTSFTISLAVAWKPVIGATETYTDWLQIPDDGSWYVADLGEVSLPKVRSGTQGWIGKIMATGTNPSETDDVSIDWVMLLPVDEGSGLQFNNDPSMAQTASGQSLHIRHDGAFATTSGGYLAPLHRYEGDYLVVPPSGAESRTLRVIVKMSVGDTGFAADPLLVLDDQIDDISARLFVTPRYLVVPEP